MGTYNDEVTFSVSPQSPDQLSSEPEQRGRKRKRDSINAPGASPLKRTFPSLLSHSRLSEEECRLRARKLYLESAELDCKFHKLCSSVLVSLDRRGVSKKKLVACLMGLNTFSPVYKSSDCSESLLNDRKKELMEAEDLDDVWVKISDYFSFFNYYLVEHIADTLGTDEDKQRVASYKKAFVAYAKRRVYECPAEMCSESKGVGTTIIVKLDRSYDNCTLQQLQLFEDKLADILQLREDGVLRLCHVQPGCYELTFQAPFIVETAIFPLSLEQEATLKALGVIQLSCGNYRFSSEQNEVR